MGLRGFAVHLRHRRRGERGRAGHGGGWREERRGGRCEPRPAVPQGGATGRSTRRPCPRAAGGRRQVVRSPGDRTYRAGEDRTYSGSRRDPLDVPGSQVESYLEPSARIRSSTQVVQTCATGAHQRWLPAARTTPPGQRGGGRGITWRGAEGARPTPPCPRCVRAIVRRWERADRLGTCE